MTHDPYTDLRRYAADLEAQVSSERAHQASRQALYTPVAASKPRRLVIAIATTALMGVSNVALAAAANPAAPGDALYGVDRAYESVGNAVGISGSHTTERADEVLVLRERGKSAEALELVQETLGTILASDDPVAEAEAFTEGLGATMRPGAVNELLAVARGVDTVGADVATAAKLIVESIVLPEQARPGGPDNPGRPDNPGERGNRP